MVPFADYALPAFYKKEEHGVLNEHLFVRSDSGLFDVSHMGQIKWHGKDAIKFLETMVCSDLAGLQVGTGLLSLITNEEGGLLDDTVIVKAEDRIEMVVNGGCKHKDMDHFKKYLADFKGDVTMEYMEDSLALLALQGPKAAASIQQFLPENFDMSSSSI